MIEGSAREEVVIFQNIIVVRELLLKDSDGRLIIKSIVYNFRNKAVD